jgi:excinuclease ABC subunit C
MGYNEVSMNKKLAAKLRTLPTSPGVYFHKSKTGEIIYVGKAAVLKNRVRQYFQQSRLRDPKTDALVAEIYDTDWMEVESEIDALFLESEMVKRYMPRYNILLRDDKSQIYVRINMKSAYPYISYTRQPMDDGAEYYGPYYNGWAVKKAMRYLRRAFPYSTHVTLPKRVCLQYHLGLCPGVEEHKISSHDYKASLRKLIMYLKGERVTLIRQLEAEMKVASAHQEFERAAKLRNQIQNLRELQKQIVFSDREFLDISKDQALAGLQQLLTLAGPPRRIEGYDISHMSGTNTVSSMVVATNGAADKSQYRKFKMQIPGNNDFAHMNETMLRRFSGKHLASLHPDLSGQNSLSPHFAPSPDPLRAHRTSVYDSLSVRSAEASNHQREELLTRKGRGGETPWPKPDLLLIDGGKGQLGAALDGLEERGVHIPAIGLAKRLEEIVIHKTRSNVTLDPTAYPGAHITENDDFYIVLLPHDSHIVRLLQRIRDESHRFAVSYHTVLKRQKQTASELEDIPGIGPATRKKLIRSFGSLRAVKAATREQMVVAVGESKASILWKWLAR